MRVAKPVGLFLILLAVFVSGGSFAADKPNSRPNVLVWMMDDVGFAQVSAYGGLVETPDIDRVAANGLTFSNYHTAPIYSRYFSMAITLPSASPARYRVPPESTARPVNACIGPDRLPTAPSCRRSVPGGPPMGRR